MCACMLFLLLLIMMFRLEALFPDCVLISQLRNTSVDSVMY